MNVIKFKPKPSWKGTGSRQVPASPQSPTVVQYGLEIINAAMKRDNWREVSKNLLTWFIVNSSQETLTRFISWIVEGSKRNSTKGKN